MPKKIIRLVIDTNIWISFLIGKTLSVLAEAIVSKNVIILFSVELFEELIEVLQRPRFEKYFSQENIQEFISLIFIQYNKKSKLLIILDFCIIAPKR